MKRFAKWVLPALLPLAIACTPQQQGNAAGLSKEEVEEIVHNYILDNPQIILEAVGRMRAQEQQQRQTSKAGLIAAEKDALFYSENDHYTGNAEGDLVIVEFFDYRCGYCKRFHPVRDQLLAADKNIRFVLKEFPVLGPESEVAARAAIAARNQGKYLEFHDAMMETRGRLDMGSVMAIAEETGLDLARLGEDMKSDSITNILRNNAKLARALEINGTPGFVIGDHVIPGAISLDVMQQVAAKARTSCKDNKVC